MALLLFEVMTVIYVLSVLHYEILSYRTWCVSHTNAVSGRN